MASSNSRSSSRSVSFGNSLPVLLCYHGQVAPVRVVGVDGPTRGRRFYGCSHWPRTCGFFKWVDVPDEVRELQERVIELEEEVKYLNDLKRKLQDDLEEATLENVTTREELYTAAANKKFMVYLVLSWVFFAFMFFIKN